MLQFTGWWGKTNESTGPRPACIRCNTHHHNVIVRRIVFWHQSVYNSIHWGHNRHTSSDKSITVNLLWFDQFISRSGEVLKSTWQRQPLLNCSSLGDRSFKSRTVLTIKCNLVAWSYFDKKVLKITSSQVNAIIYYHLFS